MNNQFKNYVTDKSFNLSLSKGQVAALVHLNNGDRDAMLSDSWAVTHLQRLQFKGLVKHNEGLTLVDWNNGATAWSLTKAGELMIGLLSEAGLIQVEQTKSEAAMG